MIGQQGQMDEADLTQMNDYDRRAWQQVQAWKQPAAARRLVPQGVGRAARAGAARLSSGARALPGADVIAAAVDSAVGGLLTTVDKAATATLRRKAIVSAYAAKDHPVTEVSHIRALPLEVVDKVKPRLDLRYGIGSAVEGAAAGAGMTAGAAAAAAGGVFGLGAGAAPGIGVLVGVTAADAVAVLAACSRATAEVAAYYGYDVELPHERLYAAGVLGVGLASQSGKSAAFRELNKLVQALARRKSWEVLNQNVMTSVIRSVFSRFGQRVTQRKLGQAVPVAGVLIGAGLNAATLHKAVEAADMVYRERFLREKYRLEEVQIDEASDEDAVDLAEILDAEIVDDQRDEGPGRDGAA